MDVNAEFSSHMSINSVAIPCSLLYLLDLIFNTSICGHKKHSKGFERLRKNCCVIQVGGTNPRVIGLPWLLVTTLFRSG